MASPESRGVAAGRFAPFHRGHQQLIERARGLVDALDVVVVHEPGDGLAPELRTGWIRDAFAEHPQVQVHAVPAADDPAEAVRGRLVSAPDICFTGAGHDGWAAALAPRHVEIDRLPGIDSEVVRADALAALDQLPGGTRASVVRRVCVLGAESTGKTTLARDLADALATVWVPEYGRDYTETLPDRLRYVWTTPDFEIISKRQNWNEDRAARYANRIVIVDTDAFATSLFHELYVGYRAPELDAYLRNYDLYLLTSIDTPFQMDNTGLRYDGDTRAFMDTTYRRHAEESGRPWVTLQGAPQERLRTAFDAVSTMLARYAGPAALTDLRAPAPVRVAAR
ncbi:MAG: HTH-type transcriptional regulator, transcriptional repressor of biosynthesis s [Gaiellales bacterium]|nr:HTH-type transcriptional regulator, transcriptional repressor of biosynthesis s [Gaiellales bacterium]